MAKEFYSDALTVELDLPRDPEHQELMAEVIVETVKDFWIKCVQGTKEASEEDGNLNYKRQRIHITWTVEGISGDPDLN